MIRIFIGYDHVESEAYHVFCHSLLERSSVPVQITPIQRRQLPLSRPRHPLQSNDFAFSRWLVPWMCDYEGWAIFVDCDFLCRWDIADLMQYQDESKSILVCKHKWDGEEGTKFLGATQTAYSMKCWSSLMLFNNAKCKILTPKFVNEADGLDLHQFKWLKKEAQIGDLPVEWNWLVDVYPHSAGAKMVHFTKGGPYFLEYNDCDYAEEWFIQRDKAFWTKQRSNVVK